VLPDTALVQEAPQGRQWEVPLADVPEFVTALELGEEKFVTGIIPPEQFNASCYSVELNLINQAFEKGVNPGRHGRIVAIHFAALGGGSWLR